MTNEMIFHHQLRTYYLDKIDRATYLMLDGQHLDQSCIIHHDIHQHHVGKHSTNNLSLPRKATCFTQAPAAFATATPKLIIIKHRYLPEKLLLEIVNNTGHVMLSL